LKKAGYNIDFSYYPAVPYEYIKSNENEESYYSRSHFMTMQILSRHLTSGENIMFVGHAPTIEGCTRQLTGGKPRSTEDFIRINRKVPFLSIAQCEKDIESGRWSLVQPMIPPMRHSQLEEFNFNDLGAKLINKYSNKKTNSNDYNTYPVRILF
jgi:ubiquitin-associated and SH3 domain-containing protein